jgi:hypothetical protein
LTRNLRRLARVQSRGGRKADATADAAVIAIAGAVAVAAVAAAVDAVPAAVVVDTTAVAADAEDGRVRRSSLVVSR